MTGFSGVKIVAFSSMTSATRLPLAALMVSITKIIESIISEFMIVMT